MRGREMQRKEELPVRSVRSRNERFILFASGAGTPLVADTRYRPSSTQCIVAPPRWSFFSPCLVYLVSMLPVKTLSLLVLLACVAGQVELTCRPSCCAWREQTYGTSLTDPSPRGFAQITLPNPEDMLSDPCITLTANSTNQYIEVLVSQIFRQLIRFCVYDRLKLQL